MEKIYTNQKCHIYLYCFCLLLLPLSLLSQIPKSNDQSEGNKSGHESRHQIDDHIFYEHIPKHQAREKHRSEIHNPQYITKNKESKTKDQSKTNSELELEKEINKISSKEDNTDFSSVEQDNLNTWSEAINHQPSDSIRNDADEEVYLHFSEGMPGMINHINRYELIDIDNTQNETPEAGMPKMSMNERQHQDGGFTGSRPEIISSNRNGPQARRHGGMHGMGQGMSGPKLNNGMSTSNQSPTAQDNSSYAFGLISILFNSAYEILMFVFVGGFIYNCFFGKTRNDKYSQIWYNANKEYFEKRYETVGYKSMTNKEVEDEDEIKPTNFSMIKENSYVFKLICYKYRYIKALLVILEFHKRQDAISMVTTLLVNTKDRLIYQVVIEPIDDVCWMFCVCRKRDAKMLKKLYADISFFGKGHDPSIFNEKSTVLTENLELFVELFQNKNLLSFFKSLENYIDMIYYTDQQTVCKDKHALFFSFELHLNKTKQEKILLEITHFVNLFADTLAQLRVDENIKKEFEKNRLNYERSKMEDVKRKEIEEIEKRDFIEQWKEKNKNKYKKIGQKKNKEKNK